MIRHPKGKIMRWTDILRNAIATGIRLPANDRDTSGIALAPSASAVPEGVLEEIESIRNSRG